jgi:hypothetical protein
MKSEEIYYPPLRWYESEVNVLTMDELIISNNEHERLCRDSQEYDFLMGITPKVLPDYWEEED